MQNLNLGLWQGMQVSEVRHKQPKVYRQWQEQPENVCPPDGEMIEQAEQRIRTVMNKAPAAAQGRSDRPGDPRAAGQHRSPISQEG